MWFCCDHFALSCQNWNCTFFDELSVCAQFQVKRKTLFPKEERSFSLIFLVLLRNSIISLDRIVRFVGRRCSQTRVFTRSSCSCISSYYENHPTTTSRREIDWKRWFSSQPCSSWNFSTLIISCTQSRCCHYTCCNTSAQNVRNFLKRSMLSLKTYKMKNIFHFHFLSI